MIPKKTNRSFLVVVCLIFILGISLLCRYNGSFVSKFSQSTSRSVIVPVSSLFSNAGNTLHKFTTELFSYTNLHNKYTDLKNDNEKLVAEIEIRDSIMKENDRLKSMLRIYQENPNTYLPCTIIFRNPDNPNNFIINAGSKQNIEENKAVVYPIFVSEKSTHFQLIGRTTNIGFNESDVMSIFDESSNISIKNMRNNEVGNLTFDEDKSIIYIKFHKINAFQDGDVVVVSNLSSLPNDLIIGSVQKIVPTESIYYYAIIKTTIDLDGISEVMVFQ
jgi:cell shape-determining protein MreC